MFACPNGSLFNWTQFLNEGLHIEVSVSLNLDFLMMYQEQN